MTINPTVKVTIAFNDPELEPEELDEQAQQFMGELKEIDEVEVDRILDPNPPEDQPAEMIAERWSQWFESVDGLTVNPPEPINDYQQLLLDKYRQQGLEL